MHLPVSPRRRSLITLAVPALLGLLALLIPFRVTSAEPPAWRSAPVPSRDPSTAPGTVWYRAWIKPHDSFFTRHERNLFEESVTFNARGLAGAHEVLVNGIRVGDGGTFPPDYRDGSQANYRHKIPPGTLRKGQWNEIAVRVFSPDGKGGFRTDPPFVMDYFNEAVLQGAWDFYPGDNPPLVRAAVVDRPASAAFDQYRESSGVLGEAHRFVHGPRLDPPAAAAALSTAADLEIELMLAEPLVAQPTHLSFDARGRLWVAQYRQYPYPAGIRMLSRDKYYRAHYDRVPQPPPNHDRGRDIISIHEDTDGDGKLDRHKVFLEGLNMANSVLPDHKGVWVLNPPYLLHYADTNEDDLPDGPPMVHLAGFGLEDTHSTANGLAWGPDGWIYGAQGSTTSSRVLRPGLDPEGAPGIYFEGCMVWRYHPRTRHYELFAEGTGNIFSLEFDAAGRLFSGHNGAETRGWHYLQGGLYMKQGVDPGKFGPPRNPHAYGELPWMKPTAPIQRFTHAVAVVEGTALPPDRQSQLFFLDPIHSLILAVQRFPWGATFQTTDIGSVVTSKDEGFRPVFITNGPDGALWVADFYEHYIAHGQHYQSQIDPTSGRIYRIKGRAQQRIQHPSLAGADEPTLIATLSHPNKWHRTTATRLLAQRQSPVTTAALRLALTNPVSEPPRDSRIPTPALGALWSLYQGGTLDETTLLQALKHPDAQVRLWTVRLAADHGPPARGNIAPLIELARTETNPEVAAQLAATSRRMDGPSGLRVVQALLTNDRFADDPCVPLLCWWTLESQIATDPEPAIRLLTDPENPALWKSRMAQEHLLTRLMRRLCAEDRAALLTLAQALMQQAPSTALADRLLQGFEQAFQGRSLVGVPASLIAAIQEKTSLPLTLQLRLKQPGSIAQARMLLEARDTPDPVRLSVLGVVADLALPELLPTLLTLAAPDRNPPVSPALRNGLFAALAPYEDPRIADLLLASVATLPPQNQAAGVGLLLSRPAWARVFLDAVARRSITPALLSPGQRDRLRRHPDTVLARRAAELLPETSQGPTAGTGETGRILGLLKKAPGDPYKGEALFDERCASCHRLFFKGGQVGPDLTPYQRDSLSTLLTSILQPSAEIREGFASVEVTTRDGRSLGGFIVDRDPNRTLLRGLDGMTHSLRQEEIVSLELTGRSLMPDGLLDGLDDQALRDLFAYLRSSQPFSR